MTAPVFVDTNVLVYARDTSERDKQGRAAAWMESLWRSRLGRTSVQVLSEFYVTVTAKLKPGLAVAQAQADVAALLSWKPIPVDAALLESAFEVQGRWKLCWWDCLVVAAARSARCGVLLSEDFGDGRRFGEIEVVSPFRHGPADLP
jgi:predicted nucleic acid-binding protein